MNWILKNFELDLVNSNLDRNQMLTRFKRFCTIDWHGAEDKTGNPEWHNAGQSYKDYQHPTKHTSIEIMTAKLVQVVTRNYEKFLTNPKFHDVVIKVGEESNVREFHVHSQILAAQSPYFAAALSSNWARRDENNIINFNKPNISPCVFELVLK